MIQELTRFVMKKIGGKREIVATPRLIKVGAFEDVITIRDDDLGLQRATNIPWVLGDWHPDVGFEWGYSGGGPTYFAINILMHFTDHDEAFSRKHHLNFRDRFVATLPRPGGRITKEDIFDFIAEKRSTQTLG